MPILMSKSHRMHLSLAEFDTALATEAGAVTSVAGAVDAVVVTATEVSLGAVTVAGAAGTSAVDGTVALHSILSRCCLSLTRWRKAAKRCWALLSKARGTVARGGCMVSLLLLEGANGS